jgi:hypothetical protein
MTVPRVPRAIWMPLMPDAILGKCQKYREIASVNPSHYAFTFQIPHLIRAGRAICGQMSSRVFNHNGSAADMDELTFSNPSSNHTNGHG